MRDDNDAAESSCRSCGKTIGIWSCLICGSLNDKRARACGTCRNAKGTATAATPIKKTSVDGGASSYVYLLSDDEYFRYLDTENLRGCVLTAYACRKSDYLFEGNLCFWWLRSSWNSEIYAGNAAACGCAAVSASSTDIAVRPVMWVKIASLPAA